MSMSLLLSVNGKTPLSDADVCLVDITTQKETSFCAKTNINGEYGIEVDSLTYWNGRAAIKSSKGKTQVFNLYDSSDTNVSDARSSIVALQIMKIFSETEFNNKAAFDSDNDVSNEALEAILNTAIKASKEIRSKLSDNLNDYQDLINELGNMSTTDFESTVSSLTKKLPDMDTSKQKGMIQDSINTHKDKLELKDKTKKFKDLPIPNLVPSLEVVTLKGVVDVPFSTGVGLNNAATGVSYSIITGPSGLTIDSTLGILSGWTPSYAASYSVTIRATNSTGSDQQTYTIDISPNPASGGGTSPNPCSENLHPCLEDKVLTGRIDENFIATVGLSNTATGVTYSIIAGSLKTRYESYGLTIDSSTGEISGFWINSYDEDTYTLIIRAENGYGFDVHTYQVKIEIPILVLDTLYGIVGEEFIATVNTAYDYSNLEFTIMNRPSGAGSLTINEDTGFLSGWTPSYQTESWVRIRIENQYGNIIDEQSIPVDINPGDPPMLPPGNSILSGTVLQGYVGCEFRPTIPVFYSGNGEVTYSIDSYGSSSFSGIYSGTGMLYGWTPTNEFGPGTGYDSRTVRIKAENSNGADIQEYNINISANPGTCPPDPIYGVTSP